MHQRAIVLLAHGSRDPLWSRPVQAVAARVHALDPAALVCCAYLELMQPDLAGAVRKLVAAGATSIRVVPMLLGVGHHARRDLPRLVKALALEFSQVGFQLLPAIGEDDRVLDLVAAIASSWSS